MLIATAFVSVAVAIVAWRKQRASEIERAVFALQGLNAGIFYDNQYDLTDHTPNTEPGGPRWLRQLLGEFFFTNPTEVSFYSAVNGVKTNLNDDDLEYFRALTQVEEISFAPGSISGSGLVHLRSSNLRRLTLDDNPVTDAGLSHLSDLPRLEELTLGGTKVTDTGLTHLEGISSLRYVYVGNTMVTRLGADRLSKALPDCKVAFD